MLSMCITGLVDEQRSTARMIGLHIMQPTAPPVQLMHAQRIFSEAPIGFEECSSSVFSFLRLLAIKRLQHAQYEMAELLLVDDSSSIKYCAAKLASYSASGFRSSAILYRVLAFQK